MQWQRLLGRLGGCGWLCLFKRFVKPGFVDNYRVFMSKPYFLEVMGLEGIYIYICWPSRYSTLAFLAATFFHSHMAMLKAKQPHDSIMSSWPVLSVILCSLLGKTFPVEILFGKVKR